jgi:hypothetical protein
MEMLNRNRRDVLKGAAASLAPTVWTSVSAAAVDRKAGAIAIDKVLSDAVQEKQVPGIVGIAANGSGVIYEGAFGKRNVETGPTMTLSVCLRKQHGTLVPIMHKHFEICDSHSTLVTMFVAVRSVEWWHAAHVGLAA